MSNSLKHRQEPRGRAPRVGPGTLARFPMICGILAASRGRSPPPRWPPRPGALDARPVKDGSRRDQQATPRLPSQPRKRGGRFGISRATGMASAFEGAVFGPGRTRDRADFSRAVAAERPTGRTAVRGLGLQFSPADGDVWRTAMHQLPVFPFRTPRPFTRT